MSTWNSLDPNQLLPSELTSAVSGITSALSSALSALSSGLSIPSLPSLPSTDTTSIVINAILDTIQGLLTAGKLHVLIIPIAKTIPLQPPPPLPPTLTDLQNALAIDLGPPDTIAADAYSALVTSTGGNAGFYNAFATSLTNPADPNRPQYDDQSDAVFMATMLIGAPRYASITSAASMLDQLTMPKGGNGTVARTIPVPQNLIARPVDSPISSDIGTRLDWDIPKNTYTSPYFAGISVAVTRYAVIRSTDPKARAARTVLDFFSTQNLTEGLTAGLHKVISIGSGRTSAYLDTDQLDPAVPVYYCVAWETAVTELGTTTTLPFDKVSNVEKVSVVAPPPPQTGTSPSWEATGSAIEAFPPLAKTAQTLLEQARVLAKPSGSSSSRLNDAMALTTDAFKRLSARASELATDVKRLATSLARPIPSMYVTQISGTGGNAFLLQQLARRLGDTSDPSRPPFDNGEYVCGVCFVAGAPRAADLAALLTFFEALFGTAAPANPLLGLLAAIDTAVTQAEAAVFGPNMKPLPAGTVVDPITGKAPVPATQVIANDGTPVTGDSPQNPNAGNTNVTPTSELC